MTEVTYACPYCGALTSLEREGYLADKSVTKRPLDGWEYAATTGDVSTADGVELVCLGDVARPDDRSEDRGPCRDGTDRGPAGDGVGDGCGRTFYLNFVRFEAGEAVADGHGWLEDEPSFEFLRR